MTWNHVNYAHVHVATDIASIPSQGTTICEWHGWVKNTIIVLHITQILIHCFTICTEEANVSAFYDITVIALNIRNCN